MRRLAYAVSAVAAVILMMARVESRGIQTPPQKPATGVILGRVLEATTGAPVRGAIVRIFGTGRGNGPSIPSVMADNEGQFVIAGVPAGSFALMAIKFGYADGAYGARRPNRDADPTPFVLGDDERRGDVTIRLWKHAAIGGTVLDEFGEPAVGVNVRAFPRVFIAGRPRLGAAGAGYGRTDDRGIYRISQLVAGDYVVAIVRSEETTPLSIATQAEELSRSGDREAQMAMFEDLQRAGLSMSRLGGPGTMRVGSFVYGLESPRVTVRDGRLFIYPSQYYGGTSQISTTRPITLRSGQEVTGIDFAMRPVPTVRVSGQVTDQNGPVGNLPIQLTKADGGDFEIDRMKPASRAISDGNGRFTLLGVTPGEHVLRALKIPAGEGSFGIVEAFSVGDSNGTVISTPREFFTAPPPAPKAPTYFATTSVGVSDRDVDDVALVVHTGIRLSGTVEFAGALPQPPEAQVTRVRIMLEPREGGMLDWEFELTGKVTADRKFETVELPPGAYLLRVQNLPEGWSLESAMAGGRDISDTAVEISDKPLASTIVRLSDKATSLTGTVRVGTSTDQLDEATVLAFPTDRGRWVDYGKQPRRLRQADVSKSGAYTLGGLPPGDYFIAAVRDDFLSDWHDPAFLEKVLALATRVTIGPGDQKSQALVMGHIR
jgi:hypothetical protein